MVKQMLFLSLIHLLLNVKVDETTKETVTGVDLGVHFLFFFILRNIIYMEFKKCQNKPKRIYIKINCQFKEKLMEDRVISFIPL